MSNFIRNISSLYLTLSFASCGGSPGSGTSAFSGSEGGATIFFTTLNFLLFAFFIYYLLVMKPAKVEEDNHKKFIEELQKGEEVSIDGGIIGKVVQKKSDVVTLEISPKIQVKVLATALQKREKTDS